MTLVVSAVPSSTVVHFVTMPGVPLVARASHISVLVRLFSFVTMADMPGMTMFGPNRLVMLHVPVIVMCLIGVRILVMFGVLMMGTRLAGTLLWHEIHSTLGTDPGFVLDDLRMHRAGVLTPGDQMVGKEVAGVLAERARSHKPAQSPYSFLKRRLIGINGEARGG